MSVTDLETVKDRITDLSFKLDKMLITLSDIQLKLSNHEGQDYPSRFNKLENDVISLKTFRDQNFHLPVTLAETKIEVAKIQRWMFMMSGGILVLNAIIMLFGNFLLDRI